MSLGFFHFENIFIHVENPLKVQNGQKTLQNVHISLCEQHIYFLCIDYIFNAKICCTSAELGT